jgi:hypothetical protein
MKISGFTFIKNGEILGYPFIQSINSVLPIVDEFIVNIGESEDNTLELIKSINSPKIKIIQSVWNEKMQNKGFVYAQQKMIAQFQCSSDWAFYVEADEVYHENDLQTLKQSMLDNLSDDKVEGLAVNFHHFYGNANSVLNSPAWYKSELRIIKNSVRSYAPDGLFWIVLDKSNRSGRYPNAKNTGVYCHHYGWVRSEAEMNLKSEKVQKYWGKKYENIDYSQIDGTIIDKFSGTHPKIMQDYIGDVNDVYKADVNYKLTKREKKHRVLKKIEKIFNLDFSKKHYKLIK